MPSDGVRKPVHFIASRLKDLQAVPDPVRGAFGRFPEEIQEGYRHVQGGYRSCKIAL